jgi:hypothetical protein
LVGGLEALSGPARALPPAPITAFAADVARMQQGLGDEAFATARKAGQALALEAAMTEALALADELVAQVY